MFFRIVHDHDDPLVVIVPLARPSAPESLDLLAGDVDVIHLEVEMDADLRGLRLSHPLECQPRRIIEARANGGPSGIIAMFISDCHVQQRAPEQR